MMRAIIPSTITVKEGSRRLAAARYLRLRPKSTLVNSCRYTIVIRRNNQTVSKRQQYKKSTMAISGKNNTTTTAAVDAAAATEQLTLQQIRSIFLSAAIPMVGFGFMDNFVMITAGQAIDNSLGVQMGLATMVSY